MAADLAAYQKSARHQEELKRQREEGKVAKQQRRCAKFQRRLDRLAARTWDAYDQFLADQSAWEGLTNRREDLS